MLIRILLLLMVACGITALLVTPRVDLGCVIDKARSLARDEQAGWSCLHYAAARGDTSVVRDMLDYGAPVDQRNAAGRTPLIEAAAQGQADSVQVLIDANADLDAQASESGFTALHLAARQNHPAVLRRLLAAGAKVDATNQWNQTPLWLAAWQAWHGNTEVAHILEANGAAVDVADSKGHTPLHMAARTGHTAMVEFLLSHGADIEHRNVNQRTPLFQAVIGDHHQSAKLLLEHGANANVSIEGWSPLRVALEENHLDMADLLQAHGASGYERLAAAARINKGYQLLQQEKYGQAIDAFSAAIALEPDSSRGYYYRGLAFYRDGEEQKARKDLMHSLELDPGNAGALEWMATVYADVGDHVRARDLLRRLIELRPDYGKAYFLLADSLNHLGDPEAAASDRNKACTLGYSPACAKSSR